MNKFKLFFYVLTASAVLMLNSCWCSCNCDKDLGCIIMTATLNSNGQVIDTETYCSQTSYYFDSIMFDSANAFTAYYNSDSITVTSVDSIYEYNSIEDLECDETDPYESSGYYCSCAK